MAVELPSGPFSLATARVMGILDTVSDSFHGGGRRRAAERAVAMVAEGADIIEVDARSGEDEALSLDEQLRRVVPLIEAIEGQLPVPISVGTAVPDVARAAIRAGAEIVNAVGGAEDAAMRRVAAETGAAVVLVHGPVRLPDANPELAAPLSELTSFFLSHVELCRQDGIPDRRIILDPGLGLGKPAVQELAIVRNLRDLASLPYPALLTASPSALLGDILRSPTEEPLAGSLALVAWGVLNGVRIVRTHDVRGSKRVCRMIEAVLQPELVETGPL